MTRSLFLMGFFLIFSLKVSAQSYLVTGKIVNEEKLPLPFANISISGTKLGVVSNEFGDFQIELPGGKHELQLYYVGYQKKNLFLTVRSDTNVVLVMEKEVYKLEDVVITGKRNPADRIVKKVIDRREEHLRKSRKWEAETYVKGSFRLVDAPENLFGETVGGMDSIKAQDERAFIYLSETQSIMTYKDDRVKETIKASKLSGNENLPSFNTGLLININLYRNDPVIIQGAKIVSPVSKQAFQFYNYQYLGKRSEAGHTIHNIKVTPKRPEEPCVSGEIEILDSLWMIHSFQGQTTGNKMNFELLDTIQLNQSYAKADGFYYLEQSSVLIKARLLGFEIRGAFMGNFTTLATDASEFIQSFNHVLISYDSSALEHDSSFWASIRKIALSEDEQKDYEFKDSLYLVQNDPSRLDSLRKIRNQYKLSKHLLRPYTYTFSDLKTRFVADQLLTNVTFNPVQGLQINNSLELKRDLSFSGIENTYWKYYADVNYGFTDGVLRYALGYEYRSDNRSDWDWSIEGGHAIREFNGNRSMSPFLNTFSNVIFKEHFHRYYESRFLELDVKYKRIRNINFHLGVMYESRAPLTNQSQWSVFHKDRDYPSNTPGNDHLTERPDLLASQNAFVLTPKLFYQPGQRYIDYPNSRLIFRSKWPVFHLSARFGLPAGGASASFTELYLTVYDKIKFRHYGNSRLFVAGSSFLNSSELSFYDYRHFSGNDFQLADFNYYRSFLLMPIYEKSTDSYSLQINYEHNFSGFVLNKLPFLRKLGLETVVGMSYLETQDTRAYTEFSVGIDRIGIKFFRPLRFDYVWQYEGGQFRNSGWVIGITQSLNSISF